MQEITESLSDHNLATGMTQTNLKEDAALDFTVSGLKVLGCQRPLGKAELTFSPKLI